MSKIISISINNKNEKYAIIFDNKHIEKFICVPSDFSIDEFMTIVFKELSSHFDKIIYDSTGYGLALSEYFSSLDSDKIVLISQREIQNTYPICKNEILKFAINTDFNNAYKKVNFEKLIKEFNNVVPDTSSNGLLIKCIKNNIGTSRYICFAQYITYLLMNNELDK